MLWVKDRADEGFRRKFEEFLRNGGKSARGGVYRIYEYFCFTGSFKLSHFISEDFRDYLFLLRDIQGLVFDYRSLCGFDGKNREVYNKSSSKLINFHRKLDSDIYENEKQIIKI